MFGPAGATAKIEADSWARYQLALAVTVASALGIVLDDVLHHEPGAIQIFLAPLHLVGIAVLVFQLLRAPAPRSRREQVVKILAVLMLAAPTLFVAIVIAVGIAREGDNAWMAAPLVIPGVVLTPYAVLAVIRLLRASPHQIG